MRISYYFAKFIKKMHLPAVKNSDINKKAKVCPGAHILDSQVGKYSYVGNFSTIINCEIGGFCSIADYCEIGAMSHPLDWVTTSPVMYGGKNCLKKNFSNRKYNDSKHTVIQNDVWIGAGAKIKAGVRISTGAVIGMGSVLTKDVGPYEIWAGNPARLIRKRFGDEIIEELLKSNWWTWNDEKISEYADIFDNPNKFCEVIE